MERINIDTTKMNFQIYSSLAGLVFPVFVIYVYVKQKNFRKKPGDIFVMMTVYNLLYFLLQIFMAMSLIVTSTETIHKHSLLWQCFCFIVLIINNNEYFYNIALCV